MATDLRTLPAGKLVEIVCVRPFWKGGEMVSEGETVSIQAQDALMLIHANKAEPADGYKDTTRTRVTEDPADDDDDDDEG